MFITKFVRKDNSQDEVYYYHTEAEAKNHCDLFINDDSNLYTSVSVIDEKKNKVLAIIAFNKEGKGNIFCEGDVVRIRPEFCNSAGERKYVYAITNLNERTMRCSITCLNSSMVIPGSELVGLDMIYHVGTTVRDILEAVQKDVNPSEGCVAELSCEGCLDYDDCPYHDPNDTTPYMEDDTIGCPFGLAKGNARQGESSEKCINN